MSATSRAIGKQTAMNDVEHLAGEGQPETNFAPRLARAMALVGLAVAAHVWALPILLPAMRTAGSPAAIMATRDVRTEPPTVAAQEPAGIRAAPSVTVRTELVDLAEAPVPFPLQHQAPGSSAAAGRPRGWEPERPVGTGGRIADAVVNAAVDAKEAWNPAPSGAASPDTGPAITRDRVEPAPVAAAVSTAAAPAAAPMTAAMTGPASGPAAGLAAAIQGPAGPMLVPAALIASADRPGRRDEEIVRQLLNEYAQAFERFDVQAVKALRPTLDDRALQRAFQRLDAQQFQFESCGVAVSGREANARCRGSATYRPKVGSRVLRLTAREWTFNLSRDNDRWQIVNATLQ